MKLNTIALIAAALVSTASVASANTYFEFGTNLENASQLKLGLITAEDRGVVEIYDYRTGSQGALLGTSNLRAGANTDVRVNIGIATKGDVLAVVKIDGEVAASKVFDILRD